MSSSAIFILKEKTCSAGDVCYNSYSGAFTGGGLFNSAVNMSSMLIDGGVESSVYSVVDNNGIDAIVTQHAPTHVFIEALWVVPSKFELLSTTHPYIQWIVRIHSETPFLSNEGVAVDWIFEYVKIPNVSVAFNSQTAYNDFVSIVEEQYKHKIIYLPNYYTGTLSTHIPTMTPDEIHIGCFGAIRPMKNQLIQAMAAIDFAQLIQKRLVFHMNGTRIEQHGESTHRNIQSLFNNFPSYQLVEHPWMDHDTFVDVIASMDISMQVSLSETFNIVTADAVINGVAVVVSPEIEWINWMFFANPNSAESITNRLITAYTYMQSNSFDFNIVGLQKHNDTAKKLWFDYIT